MLLSVLSCYIRKCPKFIYSPLHNENFLIAKKSSFSAEENKTFIPQSSQVWAFSANQRKDASLLHHILTYPLVQDSTGGSDCVNRPIQLNRLKVLINQK